MKVTEITVGSYVKHSRGEKWYGGKWIGICRRIEPNRVLIDWDPAYNKRMGGEGIWHTREEVYWVGQFGTDHGLTLSHGHE